MASPSIPSWNQLLDFLQEMRRLRELGIPAAHQAASRGETATRHRLSRLPVSIGMKNDR
jgi:hypothetical protein